MQRHGNAQDLQLYAASRRPATQRTLSLATLTENATGSRLIWSPSTTASSRPTPSGSWPTGSD